MWNADRIFRNFTSISNSVKVNWELIKNSIEKNLLGNIDFNKSGRDLDH